MTAEDAYAIFEAMAEIHNCTHKLKLIPPTEEEAREAEIAEEIDKES
ncbi:MAG: hypothetical protein GX828_05960 [Clostridiales bacterium]|nr:hypothetical protein [Clostridiales bacterium]